MVLQIKTNNHWRKFVTRWDVPEKILNDQFDYLDTENIDGFFCYRGHWYHLSEFMRIDQTSPLRDWHGCASDSFYSGVLIKLSPDGECFQVGTYFS